MAAIVPYEAAEQTWASMGPEMYQDAKKIAHWASKQWKKKKAKSSNKKRKHTFGSSPGSATTQRAITRTSARVPVASRTLTSYDLVDINRATDHEINRRHRDIINLKGVKLCLNAVNDSDQPLYLNVAVVVPKYDQSLSSIPVTDFFRGNADGRGTDFSTTLSALEFNTLPINRDRYHVLYHRRVTLGPKNATGGYNTDGNRSYFTIDKWIKVNRQIHYENNNPVNGRVQLAYWCDEFDRGAGDLAQPSQMYVGEHHIMYYNNVI